MEFFANRWKTVSFLSSVTVLLGVYFSSTVGQTSTASDYIQQILNDSWSSYGYIGGTSERLADQVLGFSCAEVPARSLGANALQLLRDKVAEYLYLQISVLHPGDLAMAQVPSQCFSSGLQTGSEFSARLASDVHLKSLQTAVSHQFLDRNVWTAPVEMDRTQRDQIYFNCAGSTLNIENCTRYLNKLDRLRMNFPAGIASKDELLSAVFTVTGSGDPVAGKAAYEAMIDKNHLDYFQSIFPVYSAISSLGGSPMIPSSGWDFLGSAAPSQTTSSLISLRDSVAQAKERYYQTISSQMQSACSSDFAALALSQPAALRQLLLDTDDHASSAVKKSLCDAQLLPSLQSRPVPTQVVCANAKTAESVPAGSASQTGTLNKIVKTVSKTGDGSYVVSLRVPFLPDADLALSDFDAKLASWQKLAQDYYNCESGADPSLPDSLAIPADPLHRSEQDTIPRTVSCAKGLNDRPKIRFRIQFEKTASSGFDVVKVHQCWDSDIQQSDCQKILQFELDSCERNCAQSKERCQVSCAALVNPKDIIGREQIDDWRIDSSPYTVLHETGHLLGLDDEYQGVDYQEFYLLQGEYDSLMRATNTDSIGHAALVYPLDLRQIVRSADRCN
jgi:hypothetical protein